ncbi:MBL fold metallo-hydrolase [Azospirillum sp. RWY-5-1]|uniref:MBL fold metallo-hydrolase n=1 Tax=Azospirillum oleiclasticum TaxID=2735135 RepID=A0ABX2T3Z4_9PROT|nr:MBL fold metallo-hydrolase [Azospirillum oleiclasticum]NYZ11710.1 MBL fold metallo-hydrolase [Azospirillum oleiclasticum]NYZ18871.1 MBL fold metallo-hydrolase [Azospirillum oleiclasticum]
MDAALPTPDAPETAGPPAHGEVRAVEDGLLWIRLSLPFRLNHVNGWAIDDGDGWTVVDTGVSDPRTRAAWEALLAGPLSGKPLHRVIATHFHPDHIGLAGWLVEKTGAVFVSSLTEWLFARALSADDGAWQAEACAGFYRRAGLTGDRLDAVLAHGGSYTRAVPTVPATVQRLRHGDRLTLGGASWRMIGSGGHTPEPVALFRHERPVLIAGDQVLERISPNVSVWPTEPDADPLADFLDGFAAFESLPADTLVLPSHGRPFTGLHARLAELRAHHEERLEEALALCATAVTAAKAADAMFPGPLDTHQTVFALGEAIAHLNHLRNRGAVERTTGSDGIDRYRRRADPRG